MPVTAQQLRPDTIAIHHAKEILTDRWDDSLSFSEVAQQVGISDLPRQRCRERTLRRGFRFQFDPVSKVKWTSIKI